MKKNYAEKNSMVGIVDLDTLLSTLSLMEETENLIAEFYEACGETWKENSDFWYGLAKEERKHAEYIKKLASIIREKKERFQSFRPFNPVAIKTVQRGIADNIRKVREKKLSEKTASAIAFDIERSLLENKYPEIVSTSDLEYNTLMAQIIEETKDHIRRVQGLLKGR